MKLTYIGECEHIEICSITDEKCLKRYITIRNPKTGLSECLVFCNDYLKLKAQQHSNSFDNYYGSKNIIYVVQLEIYKYLELTGNGRGNCSRNIANYYFTYLVCQRPYTYVYLRISDMIKWYYENPDVLLLRDISHKTQDFLNQLPTASSKASHRKLIALSRKIDLFNGISRGKSRDEESQQSDLLELINEVFKFCIKNK
jgi:hypothetical protein